MFAVPKEMYFHILDQSSESQKQNLGEINVDQVNVSCGPLFAGLKTSGASAPPGDEDGQNVPRIRLNHRAESPRSIPAVHDGVASGVAKSPIYARTSQYTAVPSLINQKGHEAAVATPQEESSPVDKIDVATISSNSRKRTLQPETSKSPTKKKSISKPAISPVSGTSPIETFPKQIAESDVDDDPKKGYIPDSNIEEIEKDASVTPKDSSVSSSSPSKVDPSENISKNIEISSNLPEPIPAVEITTPSKSSPPKDRLAKTPLVPATFESILSTPSAANIEQAQAREFAGINPKLDSTSAIKSVENVIYEQQMGKLLKSGNEQEIDEVQKSAKKVGKSPGVQAMAGKYALKSFYGPKSGPTAGSSRTSIEGRLVSQNRDPKTRREKEEVAKTKRDDIRKTGVKITTPDKKKKR